ncbi:MAG: NapC/NirT family cytochrome c [Candidatus Aquicultorales bacterium]
MFKKLSLLLKEPAFRNKIAALLIVLVGALAVMTATALTLTSTPYFCSFCHEMGADHASWQKSSHKNVTCIACHIPPNIVGFVEHKMVALTKELPSHISGSYEKPINKHSEASKHIPNENCDQCHKMDKRKVTASPGIIIDHEAHIKKGVACATCHNRVAHPGLKGYEDFMKMDACYRCHGLEKNAKAPGKCETCHTPEFPLVPKNHRTKAWLTPVGGERALHTKVAKEDKKSCSNCHLEAFCTSCHGMEMPHPKKDWVEGAKLHSTTGRANSASCQKCHPGPDFCAACHHKGFDSNKGTWIKLHRVQVDAKGAASCFDCHGPTYCAHCHVTGDKPASIKGP